MEMSLESDRAHDGSAVRRDGQPVDAAVPGIVGRKDRAPGETGRDRRPGERDAGGDGRERRDNGEEAAHHGSLPVSAAGRHPSAEGAHQRGGSM